MPNRVDNPGAGTRPEPARPATQGADQAQQPAQSEPAQQPATDRVEISAAAQQQAQAPAQPERGAAQEAPSAQTNSAPSGVNEQTRTQAEQLREQQNASRAPGAGNQPGNLVDVTG